MREGERTNDGLVVARKRECALRVLLLLLLLLLTVPSPCDSSATFLLFVRRVGDSYEYA
jgi:hypothetical protein